MNESPRSPGPLPPLAGPRRLGDFVLEREIGRGGMGVVWLATQESMGRKVALKTLPAFAGMDPAAAARFQREAEATGRLSHPGIVPVHGAGQHDGVLYFAMDFVDGPPLSQVVDQLGLRHPEKLRASLVEEAQIADRFPSLREPAGGTGNAYVRSCARLCAEVANALAEAHRHRIVHRDLKPSNILLHPAGRPVLVDFGLARDEQALALTRTGEQVGTPAYMAPEQASGRRRTDARVDVYGLGAVLYELLALRPPFEGTLLEITRQILEAEPVPVQRHNPNVPVDLAVIVHKCLQKDPDQRYPAIEALELDLRAFLGGERISSRAPDAWHRVRALLERRRRSLVAAGLVFVAVTSAALLAGMIGGSAAQKRGQALLPEARTELIEHASASRALALYHQAEALTGDPQGVRDSRVQDFRDAFERHYAERPEVLRQFSAVFDARERTELAELLARLDGCGSLAFGSRLLEQATVSLSVRGFREGDLNDAWRPYSAGAPLPVGEYLVRAVPRQGEPSLQWVRVARDGRTEFTPRFFAADELPAGAAACFDPAQGVWLGIARHEVTRAEFRAWLAALPDERMRQEMAPLGPDGGDEDGELPVQGLSFHQARAFAAMHGAHLPSSHELWLAGSAGLEGLLFPWGRKQDGSRVAADPFTMSRPEPVQSRTSGASLLGIQHVLGNVAEVLSPAGDNALNAGGGHFLDDPSSLRFSNGSVPLLPLRDTMHQHPNAGMRLCWFLPQPDTAAELQRADRRREEVRLSATGSVLHDWSVGADGSIGCQIELNGIHRHGEGCLAIALATPGFLQLGACTVADGHGAKLPVRREVGTAGEDSVVQVEMPAALQPGQGYRLVLDCELAASSGLVPQRDVCVLRLPLKRGGVPALYTLMLPPGSMLLDVSPPPVRLWRQGRITLVWEPTGHEQIETAVVRFRSDGMLAVKWPLRAYVEATVLKTLGQELARGRFERVRVQDFATFGECITADVRADWTLQGRGSGKFTMPDSAMVVQIHTATSPATVRFMPRMVSDTGRYCEGGYGNAALRVRMGDVSGTRLTRTQDALAELQIKLLPDELPDVFAQVVGSLADAESSAAAVLFRLSSGDSVLRPGRLVAEGTPDADGWKSMDWEFPAKSGAAARERWWLLAKGRRQLLVRLVANGATVLDAGRVFAADKTTEWFAAVRAALAVE